MPLLKPEMGHLLRRAGFGVSPPDAGLWNSLDVSAAIDALVDYESIPDDVDAKMGNAGYLRTLPAGAFDPNGNIIAAPFDPNKNLVDALQRWVFRMVHSGRPLQEKMALFWHNHFATGRTKLSEKLSFPGAVRAFAAKPADDPDGARGQIELFRSHALGNFRDLLLAVSRDPAMVGWLDGETNIVGKPQENFARELMELFTIGVDQFTEDDVYAGARVFTGWNLEPIAKGAKDVHYRGFRYYPKAHDTGYKTFSFAIYPGGGTTIPARDAANGYQDGVDLINALAAHPATGRFLARKLYTFFVSEQRAPEQTLLDQLAAVYYSSAFDMREVVRALLRSPQFQDPANHWSRYSWPAEYVARLIKEIGWIGFSADLAVFAMMGMGQVLFDPPGVDGWRLGKSWFSTTTMLARMNFAMTLMWNQQSQLQQAALPWARTPESFLAYFLDRMPCKPFDRTGRDALLTYLNSAMPWTGSPQQVEAKAAGLAHLIAASGEYQFV